jgi:hypothetical protein
VVDLLTCGFPTVGRRDVDRVPSPGPTGATHRPAQRNRATRSVLRRLSRGRTFRGPDAKSPGPGPTSMYGYSQRSGTHRPQNLRTSTNRDSAKEKGFGTRRQCCRTPFRDRTTPSRNRAFRARLARPAALDRAFARVALLLAQGRGVTVGAWVHAGAAHRASGLPRAPVGSWHFYLAVHII